MDLPRTVAENKLYRAATILSADTPSRQKDLLEHCAHDIHFWINTFVWQFNPNTIGEGSMRVGPFIEWEGLQDKAIDTIVRCIDPKTRHDLLIVKSREMGASWLCLLVMDHHFLFKPMQKYLAISRNEHAVDKPGDTDSLFWKLDFVHDHLPGWMREGRVRRRKMGFQNQKMHSFMTGQASTGKAGVGGRADAMFIDEFSQIEEDYEVYHRTSDTTGCRIFNGTHCGTGTCFHELSESKVSSIEKLQMHWSQHPDKRKGLYRWDEKTNAIETLDHDYEYGEGFNPIRSVAPAGGPFPGLRSPWYDKQVERKGSSRAVAMDLDIDAGGSQSQFFEPILVQRLIGEYCMEPTWQGDISYDRETGRPLALVPAKGGPLKLWLALMPLTNLPPEDVYFFGGDIAAGTGATPSCFSAVNLTGLKVLEYTNPFVDPKALALVGAALGWMFKSYTGAAAQWIWEHAGPGVSFGGKLMDLGYTNIYMQQQDLSYVQFGKISDKPGWTPNPIAIRVLLEDYRSALSMRTYINRSELALKETRHFRYDPKGGVENAEWESKNDPSGARVNHGDHVIADALAWKLAKPYVERRAVKKETKSTGNGVCLAWRRELRENKRREEEEW